MVKFFLISFSFHFILYSLHKITLQLRENLPIEDIFTIWKTISCSTTQIEFMICRCVITCYFFVKVKKDYQLISCTLPFSYTLSVYSICIMKMVMPTFLICCIILKTFPDIVMFIYIFMKTLVIVMSKTLL